MRSPVTFPLTLTGKQSQPLKPKAVNNAREDKLDTSKNRLIFGVIAVRRALMA